MALPLDLLVGGLRALLQEPSEGGAPADECAQPDDDQSSYKGLRIGGLFIILAVTSLGLVVPVVTKGFSRIFFLARTFGAGVILSTALIHILPDADGDLKNPCLHLSGEYPWAFAIAGTVVMITFALEYVIATYFRYRLGGSNPLTHGAHREASDLEAAAIAQLDPEKVEAREVLNATVSSYTLEAGVVLHSVFVGLAYGASTELNTIRALTIALGFHQGIEAISLGCTFIDARYSWVKYLAFGALYCLMTPIGIAIGLGVGNAYHEGSKAALGTQGTLNAVSAGILLYTGIVDIMLPSFMGHGHTHGDTTERSRSRPTWLTALGFFCMLVGFAVQSLIGKWA